MEQVWLDDSKVFWNPDMDVSRDLSVLMQLVCAWVFLFATSNKWIMQPLARFLIKDKPQRVTEASAKSSVAASGSARLRKKIKVNESSQYTNGKPHTESEQVAKLRHKFVTSMWKFSTYTGFVLFGCYSIGFGSNWAWSPETYHVVFPRGTVPRLLYWYYQLETSYYVFSLGLMAWEPKMKDKMQMTIHHLVTITLLVTSYVGRMIKFGVPIMLLHDAADPFMEAAKMFLYCGYETMANVMLGFFTATFMYLRNWVFPRHIIWIAYCNLEQDLYPYFKVTIGSLCTLALLHVYWAGLILKIGYSNYVTGKSTGDIREEE